MRQNVSTVDDGSRFRLLALRLFLGACLDALISIIPLSVEPQRRALLELAVELIQWVLQCCIATQPIKVNKQWR